MESPVVYKSPLKSQQKIASVNGPGAFNNSCEKCCATQLDSTKNQTKNQFTEIASRALSNR